MKVGPSSSNASRKRTPILLKYSLSVRLRFSFPINLRVNVSRRKIPNLFFVNKDTIFRLRVAIVIAALSFAICLAIASISMERDDGETCSLTTLNNYRLHDRLIKQNFVNIFDKKQFIIYYYKD